MKSVMGWVSVAGTGIVALTYGVGYLVSSMFYGAWGIHGHSLGLIRAHYIHVGLLCLMPPVVLTTVIVGGRWIIRQQLWICEPGNEHQLPWSMAGNATLIVLILGLYLLALLAQPSIIVDDAVFRSMMFVLPALCVLGLFIINWSRALLLKLVKTCNPATATAIDPTLKLVARWLKLAILVLAVGCLVTMAVRLGDTIRDLLEHQRLPVSLYFLLAFLVGLIGAHNVKNIVYVDKQNARPMMAAASIALLAPLMYFMILSFAFGLFRYIPASRGGANFTEARPVEIFNPPLDDSPVMFRNPDTSGAREGDRLFIIQEIGDRVFLGREREGSTASDWRHSGSLPDLIVLNREDITGIRFLDRLSP